VRRVPLRRTGARPISPQRQKKISSFFDEIRCYVATGITSHLTIRRYVATLALQAGNNFVASTQRAYRTGDTATTRSEKFRLIRDTNPHNFSRPCSRGHAMRMLANLECMLERK
jgi:hypothetical protein